MVALRRGGASTPAAVLVDGAGATTDALLRADVPSSVAQPTEGDERGPRGPGAAVRCGGGRRPRRTGGRRPPYV